MTSLPFGPLNQNAFAVADLEAGIAYWAERMNVGPFLRFPKIEYVESDYRGQNVPILTDVAIAYSGDLMIELVEPHGPSIFTEFLDAGRSDLHHLARLTDDMPAAQSHLERLGAVRVQGGRVEGGSCVAYFEFPNSGLPFIELAYLTPEVLGVFDIVKQAAKDWDGRSHTLQL